MEVWNDPEHPASSGFRVSKKMKDLKHAGKGRVDVDCDVRLAIPGVPLLQADDIDRLEDILQRSVLYAPLVAEVMARPDTTTWSKSVELAHVAGTFSKYVCSLVKAREALEALAASDAEADARAREDASSSSDCCARWAFPFPFPFPWRD